MSNRENIFIQGPLFIAMLVYQSVIWIWETLLARSAFLLGAACYAPGWSWMWVSVDSISLAKSTRTNSRLKCLRYPRRSKSTNKLVFWKIWKDHDFSRDSFINNSRALFLDGRFDFHGVFQAYLAGPLHREFRAVSGDVWWFWIVEIDKTPLPFVPLLSN